MLISRRLQYFSTTRVTVVVSGFNRTRRGLFQQSNRRIECSRTQVHVALRRFQVLMPGQFLNGSRRRSTHRQVRAERVAQDVDARPGSRALDVLDLRFAVGTPRFR